ncbi:MAG: hypothetical protein A3G33_08345 [Omnitrophica bacterium RIFCSPLOWO2_12_FULL_44_17]|uniref:Uncharacterized protein n=1 Tax=Candidatus Danuiimicrobium aquiferis TaxID=1801832 RepID=A0A1G1KW16_9BACT|nr:MAG: hypothetical protein A3B72_03565 [Omnitrophica bacterium RIFCSPHIGHO2_02_FULL_45_28]OGW90534.1 MAG: hypothetical protein A3E74_03085 [Omnitrophica bacterium RIFCSPHIGHO2_12_FULL_44_12]OGW97174.1 MAG: hypothetical protein A3G33_08345 [Omnitrophica bacterium RIFCSPLOWO2_12_FULL_44_17]OGX02233.1 MAG: hypothetical protein A3J12_08130 [Omnitrophica bacterium RIFCSPLOWO2_02_FULL_44_11]
MNMTESPRSKQKMRQLLKEHFRYHTGNSWNRATSYARNIKVRKLGLDRETELKCYDMLDIPESFDEFSAILHDFAIRHDYAWQIGQNGRSGGYLVLYQGGKKDSGHKTCCTDCFIPTWYETRQPCHVEGCSGTLELLRGPLWQPFTYPGRGTDDDCDYESWSHEDLRRRLILVKDFDRTCDLAVESFIHFAKSHKITEEEVMVPKTVKVAVAI